MIFWMTAAGRFAEVALEELQEGPGGWRQEEVLIPVRVGFQIVGDGLRFAAGVQIIAAQEQHHGARMEGEDVLLQANQHAAEVSPLMPWLAIFRHAGEAAAHPVAPLLDDGNR